MHQKKDDHELVDALRQGDSDAFIELVEKYSSKVHNLAVRLTRSQEDAEEIIQDVFVTVYRKINSFEGKSAFSSWLYRITVNTSFMKLRKRRRTAALSLDELSENNQDKWQAQEDPSSDVSRIASRDELRQAIQHAINKLPFEYRMIFVLRDIDGLSNQAVSEIMTLTVPAIKSRLHRSRLMLRKRLLKFYEDYKSSDKIFYGKTAAAEERKAA